MIFIPFFKKADSITILREKLGEDNAEKIMRMKVLLELLVLTLFEKGIIDISDLTTKVFLGPEKLADEAYEKIYKKINDAAELWLEIDKNKK
jgi:hypothetical protein